MNKNTVEIDDIDRELESWTGDYPEPCKDSLFYDYQHKLWEMRFDYQGNKNKTFDEDFRSCIRFYHKRQLIKKILDIKTHYFYETGEVI